VGLGSITHRHLILCEGMHDVQFFQHLAHLRGHPVFQASSCGNIAGAPRGRDGIDYLTTALDALPGIPNFDRLTDILVVADNDDDPDVAFQKVQQMINATAEIRPGHRYAAPAYREVKAGSDPAVTVLMIPEGNVPGALDSLCLVAARNRQPAIGFCVDHFASCVNPVGWALQKVHKMKLRALISAAHPTDPYIAPAWVWRDNTDLVPLDDPIFDRIDAFLRTFLT
jgi:hypothetical protein